MTNEEIDHKIDLAAETFRRFRQLSFAERARMMAKAAEILEDEKNQLARLMTTEMGKTYRSAVDEAVKCAWACRYYAENAQRFLADEVIQTTASKSYVKYQALGVILVVMPWNYPLWQVFRFIAPGLMAGNVGLLKHASNVPQSALKIEEILRRSGFPEGADTEHGQSCIAAKRFIVAETIADQFKKKFVQKMEELRLERSVR